MKNIFKTTAVPDRIGTDRQQTLSRLAIGTFVALAIGACSEPHIDQSATVTRGARTGAALPVNMLYTENNNPDGPQQILAYRRNTDGTLTLVNRYGTGGRGIANPQQGLGPLDLDFALTTSEDRQYLYASNGGSNTIAGFQVNTDGSLTALPGSPFPSGGINPTGMYVADGRLFVVNKNDDPTQPNTEQPNYRTLKIEANGQLSIIPDAVYLAVRRVSPSNIYVTPGRKVAIGTDFLAVPRKTGQAGSLRSFTIGANGKLNPVGDPIVVEGGAALGVWSHPGQNVLYVGLAIAGKIGVYSYESNSGQLTLNTTVAAGAAACWLRVNRAGTRLYALNSAESTISVYDLAQPTNPRQIQKYVMPLPGPMWFNPDVGAPVTTSEPFAEEFSPDERYLYVVNQHTSPDFSFNTNYLHTLVINADGTLSQPSQPQLIPSGAHYRPQGLVIY